MISKVSLLRTSYMHTTDATSHCELFMKDPVAKLYQKPPQHNSLERNLKWRVPNRHYRLRSHFVRLLSLGQLNNMVSL